MNGQVTFVGALLDFSLLDNATKILLFADLAALVLLYATGRILKKRSDATLDPAVVRSFNKRVAAWITVCVILALTMMLHKALTVVFFFLISFWALREFITMTPTRRGDHRTLFWVFIVFTPMQYILVGYNAVELYTVVIPVYAVLFISSRIAFAGDEKRFLERTAKIQFGLLICVYCLSHAPALLSLDDLGTFNQDEGTLVPWTGNPGGLLLYFIVIVQISDLMHFLWDRLVGRHVIAPSVNTTKTWEGLLGSACTAIVAGMLIQLSLPVTPFTLVGSGCMALLISVMGSSGSMTMSAIKRDRGIKDYGTLIQGHPGVLDRIDSICFAAPIFFHVTKFFLSHPVAESVDGAQSWLGM